MPRNETKWIYKLDWGVVFIYLTLVFFGWINIYATTVTDDSSIFNMNKEYGMQFVWIATALFLAFCILMLSSKVYSVFSFYIYIGIMLLLIAVLFLGKEVNGSRSWFVIGPMRLQPAEMAKLATSLALARLLSTYGFKLKSLLGWTQALVIILIPISLILLQKDWGSALVFSSFILMFYREGLSGWVLAAAFFTVLLFILSLVVEPITVLIFLICISLFIFALVNRKFSYAIIALVGSIVLFMALRYFQELTGLINYSDWHLLLMVTVVLLIVAVIYTMRTKLYNVLFIMAFFVGSLVVSYSVDYVFDNLLKQHHRDRIEDMLGLKDDIRGVGYNVHQAKVAIGSGGVFGKGFTQGTQTKLNFVPEQSTDFIFCTVGEEWGFMGTLFLLSLYLALLIRIVFIAERQKHTFGRVYGYCVASVLFFHFAINIAMTIGLAPVIGIPLPFLSYGGSSLWSFTVLIFILLKIDAVRYGEH